MPIDNFLYAYVAQEEEYDKGDTIIKEGSRGNWTYLILEGKVKVNKITAKGIVTIGTLLEGEVFGEMILWQTGKSTRTASIVAESYVKVGILDTNRLIEEYEAISPRLKSLLGSLINKLADVTNQAVILAVESNNKPPA